MAMVELLAIMNSLDLKIGMNAIDIGCGGGHIVQEIALAVGEKGKSIGIDPSQDQLDSALFRCKNQINTKLICSNADKINIDDKYLKFICNFLFFKSRFELYLHKDKNKFYATKICLKN